MKCHYEVLGVPRDADDTEIKRSYRKLALQYHPDKNPENIEEVVELFRQVQAAYDVLSDPQERAWYDKHREAIIRGGDDYVDDSLDLMYYFNTSIYSGYGDGSKGFYAVYRDAFHRLSKEDEPFMDDDNSDGFVVPEFGYSTSDYESVVKPFYTYWLAYHTKKSYVWKDKYDIRQAANRPTQRLMEKENKKLRDAARKKRNEEVRTLVSFVRKRDKRVQEEHKKLKLKREEQERRTREKRELEKINRSKILDDYTEPEWMAFDASRLDDIDSHFDDQFGSTAKNNVDDSDEDDEPHYYCIACDKNFKSEKALANHEKSKKHKENVELIKNELADEFLEEDLLLRNSATRSGDLVDDPHDEDSFTRLSSFNLPRNIVKRNVIEKHEHHFNCFPNGDILHDDDDSITIKMRDKFNLEDDRCCSDNGDQVIFDDTPDSQNNGERKEKEEAIVIEIEGNCNSCNSVENNHVRSEHVVPCIEGEKGSATENMEKVEDKLQCDVDVSKKNNTKKKKKKKTTSNEDTCFYLCEVCSKNFPTRNKLFSHIKEEGHAVLKEAGKSKKKSKSKKN